MSRSGGFGASGGAGGGGAAVGGGGAAGGGGGGPWGGGTASPSPPHAETRTAKSNAPHVVFRMANPPVVRVRESLFSGLESTLIRCEEAIFWWQPLVGRTPLARPSPLSMLPGHEDSRASFARRTPRDGPRGMPREKAGGRRTGHGETGFVGARQRASAAAHERQARRRVVVVRPRGPAPRTHMRLLTPHQIPIDKSPPLAP